MASFSQGVAEFVVQTNEKVDKDVRAMTLGLFSAVIMSSPVGNPELWAVNSPANRARRKKNGGKEIQKPAGYVGGRFRANWNTSVGAPNYTITDKTDKSGEATKARAKANMGGAGSVTYMSNALPYGYRLEFGPGPTGTGRETWSTQAPAGMVRINMARIAEINKATK